MKLIFSLVTMEWTWILSFRQLDRKISSHVIISKENEKFEFSWLPF